MAYWLGQLVAVSQRSGSLQGLSPESPFRCIRGIAAMICSGVSSVSLVISCSMLRQQKRQRWLQRRVGVIWTQRQLSIP